MIETKEVFEPVLIKRYDGRIDSAVAKIRNDHKENAERLNKLKQDFTDYEETSFSIVSFLTFLTNDNQKAFLIDRFVKNKKLEGLPIKPEKLEEILEIPPYEHLIGQAAFFKDWSKEKLRSYYDIKSKNFAPLTVTKEEKERIIRINSFYAYSEHEYEFYKNMKGLCETLNFLAKTKSLGANTPIYHLEQLLDFKIKRGVVSKESPHGGIRNHFSINYDNFQRG